MDKKLIAKEVLRRIEEHPTTFNQWYWYGYNPRETREEMFKYTDDASIENAVKRGLRPEDLENCGSVMCNAGHTVAVAYLMYPEEIRKMVVTEHVSGIGELAEKILDLSITQAAYLFDARRDIDQIITAYEEIIADDSVTIPL